MARPPLPTAGPGVRLPAPMCGSQDGSGGRGRAVGEQAPCVGLWPLWSGPGQGPGGAPPLSAPDSGGQRVPGLARSRVSLRGAWHGRGQPARAARRGRRRRGASGRCGRTVTSKTQPSSPAPPPPPRRAAHPASSFVVGFQTWGRSRGAQPRPSSSPCVPAWTGCRAHLLPKPVRGAACSLPCPHRHPPHPEQGVRAPQRRSPAHPPTSRPPLPPTFGSGKVAKCQRGHCSNKSSLGQHLQGPGLAPGRGRSPPPPGPL